MRKSLQSEYKKWENKTSFILEKVKDWKLPRQIYISGGGSNFLFFHEFKEKFAKPPFCFTSWFWSITLVTCQPALLLIRSLTTLTVLSKSYGLFSSLIIISDAEILIAAPVKIIPRVNPNIRETVTVILVFMLLPLLL